MENKETGALRDGELALVNKYTRREHKAEEIYAFTVTLCDNDIDRDFERFSDDALDLLSKLFVGRTGICDHSAKSENQKARIFSCYTETPKGEQTRDGRRYKRLCARAYMLKTEQNKDLIAEIEAGIKKEVSVGCSMGKHTCSICGKPREEGCIHRKGKLYGNELCHTVLENPCDAYEWSFVAVPAQRRAGITKSFAKKERKNLTNIDIIKQLGTGEEITLSGTEAAALSLYINELKTLSDTGRNFIAEKRTAVIVGCENALSGIKSDTIKALAEKMSVAELDEFYRVFKKEKSAQVQLAPKAQNIKSENTDFMI